MLLFLSMQKTLEKGQAGKNERLGLNWRITGYERHKKGKGEGGQRKNILRIAVSWELLGFLMLSL